MNQTIYKYPLEPAGHMKIVVRLSAATKNLPDVLCVRIDPYTAKPCLWMEGACDHITSDFDQPCVLPKFEHQLCDVYVYKAGNTLDPRRGNHIGEFEIGRHVFHVYSPQLRRVGGGR